MNFRLHVYFLALYAAAILSGCGDFSNPGRGDLGKVFVTGASPGDKPYPIALGGEQTIHVWLDEELSQPFSDPATPTNDSDGGPFCGEQQGDSPPPAFCSYIRHQDSMEILQIPVHDPPDVRVRGVAIGEGTLVISPTFSERPGESYDEYSLEVVEVANVKVTYPPDFAFNLVHGAGHEDIVYAVGSRPPEIVFGLFTEDERRAVDESLTFEGLPDNLHKDPGTWDTLKVDEPFTKSGDWEIKVRAGDGSTLLGTAAIQVVNKVNLIKKAKESPFHSDEALVVGRGRTVCFESHFEDPPDSENYTLIYGAVVTVEAVQNVTVSRFEENSDNSLLSKACWNIVAQDPGICGEDEKCPTIRVFSKATNLDDETDLCGDGTEECGQEFTFNAVSPP